MADYSKADHYTLKAQKEGYPARSVYKLKEMDEKFSLIKHGSLKILDLGAAPGSWSLYVLHKLLGRTYGRGSGTAPVLSGTTYGPSLVAIDLSPLSRQYDHGLFDKPDFLFIQGDFTRGKIREDILFHGPYRLLLSDAAPATTGNRSVDTLRSLELAEAVLDYAATALVKEGNLVLKVFQGGGTDNLLKAMRSHFESARSFKPRSCRAESFETYYLGLGKK